MKDLFAGKCLLFSSFIFIIILSGCSRYQYISINSNIPQTENKDFVIENDTVIIRYTFAGQGLPLIMTLYNKLLQPVYIDYSRSTVIINNYQKEGAVFNEGEPGFIAPRSYVKLKSVPLRVAFFNPGSQDTIKKVVFGSKTGKKHTYNEESTPFFFRSILALTTYEDYIYPTFFDYSFWVSDVIESRSKPASIKDLQPNQTYIKRYPSHPNVIFYGVVVGAALIPLIIFLAVVAGS
jgi:hypothetical protein